MEKFDKAFTERMRRFRIEQDQDWRGEVKRLPFIQFPADWAIQVIPPFSDAVVRFRVRLPSGLEKSVYMDSRDSIGYMGYPYWEVYPYKNDVGRCALNAIDTLLALIANEETGDGTD